MNNNHNYQHLRGFESRPFAHELSHFNHCCGRICRDSHFESTLHRDSRHSSPARLVSRSQDALQTPFSGKETKVRGCYCPGRELPDCSKIGSQRNVYVHCSTHRQRWRTRPLELVQFDSQSRPLAYEFFTNRLTSHVAIHRVQGREEEDDLDCE